MGLYGDGQEVSETCQISRTNEARRRSDGRQNPVNSCLFICELTAVVNGAESSPSSLETNKEISIRRADVDLGA